MPKDRQIKIIAGEVQIYSRYPDEIREKHPKLGDGRWLWVNPELIQKHGEIEAAIITYTRDQGFWKSFLPDLSTGIKKGMERCDEEKYIKETLNEIEKNDKNRT